MDPSTGLGVIGEGEYTDLGSDRSLEDIDPTSYHGGEEFVGYSALEVTWQVVAICFSCESDASNANGAAVVTPNMSGTTIYYVVY